MPRTSKRVVNARRRGVRTDAASSNRRLFVGRLLLVVALVVAGAKLVHVQGFQASALSGKSEQQRVSRDTVPAERGSVVDRDGNALAFSTEKRQLYANPKMLTAELAEARKEDPSEPAPDQYKREMARFVHETVGDAISEGEVLEALFSDDSFTYFGSEIDPSKARKISEKYPQIGSEYRATREYPAGNVASNIVGAANWRMDAQEVQGVMGLESSMDDTLSGEQGMKVSDTAMGSSNLVIPGSEREIEPAVPGSDVELTIDSDLQYVVQRKLADYAQRAGANSASAVVLDAKTGETYALANGKSFDPRDKWGENLGNAAVTTPFEPGSVNKLITAAGAIEHNLLKPESVMQVPGSTEVADRTVSDAWQHGTIPLTFTGVLAKSSNVGTLMAAQKLGEDRFADMARKFGLGQRTGIELGGETAGSFPPRDEWSGSTFANLPIGQGLSMTVLQMAGMYQAIANDGVRVPPRVVSAEVGPDGQRHERPDPEGVRVVKPETARTVRDMLRGVVQDAPNQEGTGSDAALEGYQVSGKTGTAQQIDPETGSYSNENYWITFAGMVPAQNPRFVVGLMLDAPTADTEEASSAAPLFHDIASFIAQRYQIPLSKEPAPVQVLQPGK